MTGEDRIAKPAQTYMGTIEYDYESHKIVMFFIYNEL